MLYDAIGVDTTPVLMDLLDSDNISDGFYHTAMEIIDKENDTPADPPINRGAPKLFNEYTPQEMYECFRFSHHDVQQLITSLNIPRMMRIEGRWYHQEEMMIILF